MPPVSKKKSPAVGGEAKKKRRVLVRKRSHGGPGKKTQAVRGEVAAGSSQIQMQMPMKKKDGNKHEILKKSGRASSPGPAVAGKSAQPVVGSVGCRAGPAAPGRVVAAQIPKKDDSYSDYHSSSYRDSDYEPPAVGGAEVGSTAVRGEAPCVSDSSDDSRYDMHRRQRRQSPAKKSKSGDGVVAAPLEIADESHSESESDSRAGSRAGRPLRLTPAGGADSERERGGDQWRQHRKGSWTSSKR